MVIKYLKKFFSKNSAKDKIEFKEEIEEEELESYCSEVICSFCDYHYKDKQEIIDLIKADEICTECGMPFIAEYGKITPEEYLKNL